ncbi:hypothetical protein Cflav_PD4217 [Pedosphaera parvula Ellin514]|uniref:Uncharacterized protein n=1 Tax=Pedosphaera parvula (strain Ellin514) TaxID=320771 RepID=B9XF41_PEDPL|nr:hypothetical protein Cflav_PD4217 [Pedosphaera parvula Ellin514]
MGEALTEGLEIVRNLQTSSGRTGIPEGGGTGLIPHPKSDDYLLAGLRFRRFITDAEFSQAWSLFFRLFTNCMNKFQPARVS